MKSFNPPLCVLITFLAVLTISCGGKIPGEGSTVPGAARAGTSGTGLSHKVTFIELGSDNCVPCRMMKPVMEEIRKEYPRDVKVVYYDVWTPQGRPYGSHYGIRVIPTQIFLDSDGREFFRHEGFLAKEKLVEVIRQKGAEK